MFSAILSVSVLLGAAVITSSSESHIRLQPSDTIIEEGKPFYIDVFAFAHVPVNAVDVTISFDKDIVTVAGIDTGQSVLTIWTQEPVVEDNKVLLRGGTFRKGFIEEHRIATINLVAKKTGGGSIDVSNAVLLAGDGEGTPVAVAEAGESSIDLYVYDQNEEPGSIGVNVSVDLLTDLSGDGKVSLRDVSMFMVAWNKKNKVLDFNGDGKMTFKDFSIILSHMFLK